jgi:hypothetical protein
MPPASFASLKLRESEACGSLKLKQQILLPQISIFPEYAYDIIILWLVRLFFLYLRFLYIKKPGNNDL